MQRSPSGNLSAATRTPRMTRPLSSAKTGFRESYERPLGDWQGKNATGMLISLDPFKDMSYIAG